jgi:hypothetical protein
MELPGGPAQEDRVVIVYGFFKLRTFLALKSSSIESAL